MRERPYVTLSCAMSIDGCLDSAAPHRLTMSNPADLDRVDEVRSRNDAIMVGASTVRRDNPRLLVRDPLRRERRVAAGRPWSPTKVTVTATGDLPADAAFFTTGVDVPRLVYCPRDREDELRELLGARASVVGVGETDESVALTSVLEDLAVNQGVRRLMVEGGGTVLTQLLAADLVDELQLVVAPFFVGEPGAPRAFGEGRFPWTAARRACLVETDQIGDVALLRYALSDRFGEADRGEQTASAGPLRADAR